MVRDLVEELGRFRAWGGLLNAFALLTLVFNTVFCAAGGLRSRSVPSRGTTVTSSPRFRATIQDEESVLLGADDVLLSPPAHDPDRGLDRRADHVGDLLPGQRQRDERAVVPPLTDVLRAFQEQAGEAPFDAAASQFRQAVSQLQQPVREPDEQAAHQRRIRFEQREECLAPDEETAGRLEGARTRRKGRDL
jgi:hypothetical protein